MQTQNLTNRLITAAFCYFRKSLHKSQKRQRSELLCYLLSALGGVAFYSRFYVVSVLCFVCATSVFLNAAKRMILIREIGRISRDLESGAFSGPTIARRLEWSCRIGVDVRPYCPRSLNYFRKSSRNRLVRIGGTRACYAEEKTSHVGGGYCHTLESQ